MTIHLVGAELLHVDRRTHIIKQTDAFRNFANTLKNRN